MRLQSALPLVTLLAAVWAAPSTPHQGRMVKSCNTASSRSCWTSGYTINTDYEESIPTTRVTRKYDLTITEATNWTGPDGYVKEHVMLINGNTPGPVITANWGDTVSVTVHNRLVTNGTSMHWHGIRMLNNNLNDGVNGVTECPIPPGSAKTYTFRAQQYGTTWYHSHFSAQYGNGVWGTLVINGPASANYDTDLGVLPVSDYYYDTADHLVAYTENNGAPSSNNVLFNGTNISPTTGAGRYANVTLTHGKTHRLRLLNPSVENHFGLSLVGHNMTIIAADLVPVQPVTVDQIFIGPGQRYDVLITANQAVGNYWFNATFSSDGQCGSSYNTAPAAVFRYNGAPKTLPTNPGTVAAPTNCGDLVDLTPVVRRTIPVSSFTAAAANTLPVSLDINTTAPALFSWKVNGSQMVVDWEVPLDRFVLDGNTHYPASNNIVHVPRAQTSQWSFWLVENDPAIALAHPIHLHGHDFVVLARSDPADAAPAAFDAATVSLDGNNPIRRDVVMLPSLGWLVIAFKVDNPGAWIMHCHIAWHISGGLGVTFLENPTTFARQTSSADQRAFAQNCKAWNEYYPSGDPYRQEDSGV